MVKQVIRINTTKNCGTYYLLDTGRQNSVFVIPEVCMSAVGPYLKGSVRIEDKYVNADYISTALKESVFDTPNVINRTTCDWALQHNMFLDLRELTKQYGIHKNYETETVITLVRIRDFLHPVIKQNTVSVPIYKLNANLHHTSLLIAYDALQFSASGIKYVKDSAVGLDSLSIRRFAKQLNMLDKCDFIMIENKLLSEQLNKYLDDRMM